MLTFDTFSDEEFESVFLNIIIESKKNQTYKFALARFLLDYSRDNTETSVSYSTIAEYFLEYYWPQVCRLDIRHASQGNRTPKYVKIIKEQFGEQYRHRRFSDVKREEPEKIQVCIDEIRRECFHDVTWRFQRVMVPGAAEVRAFFEYEIATETNSDNKKMDLECGIELNPKAMEFFRQRYAMLLTRVVQEWIRFLRYKNENQEAGSGSFYDIVRKAESLSLPIDHSSLRTHVWECLNEIGRTIPDIQNTEKKKIKGSDGSLEYQDRCIWHTKSDLDKYVANKLGIDMELYGSDKSKNPFYKATVNEISNLRKKGVLIDWARTRTRDMGVGIWRLDKCKLDEFAYQRAEDEIKQGDFSSAGDLRTVYVRQKQNVFRHILLEDYQKCALCGFRIPDFMIGAHIVPYSTMRTNDPRNSMNPRNGMLFCRLCDVAFEKGCIRIDGDLGVGVSELLSKEDNSPVRSWLKTIPSRLQLRNGMRYPPDAKYLEWKIDLLKDNCQKGF